MSLKLNSEQELILVTLDAVERDGLNSIIGCIWKLQMDYLKIGFLLRASFPKGETTDFKEPNLGYG